MIIEMPVRDLDPKRYGGMSEAERDKMFEVDIRIALNKECTAFAMSFIDVNEPIPHDFTLLVMTIKANFHRVVYS